MKPTTSHFTLPAQGTNVQGLAGPASHIQDTSSIPYVLLCCYGISRKVSKAREQTNDPEEYQSSMPDHLLQLQMDAVSLIWGCNMLHVQDIDMPGGGP